MKCRAEKWGLAGLLLVLPLMTMGRAQETVMSAQSPYYRQMEDDDFLKAMVPKEKYLLWIAKAVQEEMTHRQSEGVTAMEMGVEEVISPEERKLDTYEEELNEVLALLDEVEILERRARQQADLEALALVDQLKEQIQDIINRQDSDESASPDESTRDSVLDTVVEPDEPSDDPAAENFEPVTVEELYLQWKYDRFLEYKLKLTEYQFLRTRLLRTGTPEQIQRMFEWELTETLKTYNAGEYQVSRLQLKDLLDSYSNFQKMDDIYYYFSESAYALNILDEAEFSYKELINKYPVSSFASKAYVKLIYIYSIYEDFDKLAAAYEKLLMNPRGVDQEVLGTVSYLVGYSYFQSGQYSKALTALGRVDSQASYFFPSRYLSAACYANLGNEQETVNIYHQLVEEADSRDKDPVLKQIKNNALLKLGLIYYERGSQAQAMDYFNRVSEDYDHYDLSIIGKAWSAYRSGLPGESLRNAELLMRQSMMSSYAYEARVLAASSKDLLGHSEEAISDLKEVFDVRQQKDKIENIRGNDPALLETLQRMKTDEDEKVMSDLRMIQSFLKLTQTVETDEKNESSRVIQSQAQGMNQRIAELDEMERQARAIGNQSQLDEIRSLRSELMETLESHSGRTGMALRQSKVDPLLERMGMSEYMKFSFHSLLLETLREKHATRRKISEVNRSLDQTDPDDDFTGLVKLEMQKEELQDYYNKVNQYEVWLRENAPKEMKVELDQWAAFSGYGISNINFSRIKDIENRIADISGTIDNLDHVFQAKRRSLDNRIRGLLTDVAKIEEQMRREMEKREEAEKDRFFKSEYFNRQRQEVPVGNLKEKPEPVKEETP